MTSEDARPFGGYSCQVSARWAQATARPEAPEQLALFELEAIEKLRAKSAAPAAPAVFDEPCVDLLRMVCHDLATPLSTLTLQTQLLGRAIPEGDPQHPRLEAILRSTQQLTVMTKNLIDLARFETGRLQLDRRPHEVRAFALELQTRFSALLEAGEVSLEVEPDLPQISIDGDRFTRALTELFSELMARRPPRTDVFLQASRAGRQVCVTLGARKPAGDLPGASLDRRPRIGRYLSSIIVKAHGGHLEERDEEGLGRCFRIVMPVSPRRQAP